MSIKKNYDLWSETYDHDVNLTRDLDKTVLQKIMLSETLGNVIEVGCGTGKNTVWLAPCASSILAIDYSPGMLTKAQEKVSSPNVKFILADIQEPWLCEPMWADWITFNLVLEHISALEPVFSEATRTLKPKGKLVICELHPFRQYTGSQARFEKDGNTTQIPAFTHHISDFLRAASANGLQLLQLNEWWHPNDTNKPPRLLSVVWEK